MQVRAGEINRPTAPPDGARKSYSLAILSEGALPVGSVS
jgi:hypothetical protein